MSSWRSGWGCLATPCRHALRDGMRKGCWPRSSGVSIRLCSATRSRRMSRRRSTSIVLRMWSMRWRNSRGRRGLRARGFHRSVGQDRRPRHGRPVPARGTDPRDSRCRANQHVAGDARTRQAAHGATAREDPRRRTVDLAQLERVTSFVTALRICSGMGTGRRVFMSTYTCVKRPVAAATSVPSVSSRKRASE